MKRTIILQVVTGFFLFCSLAAQGKGGEEKSRFILNGKHVCFGQVFLDTIPTPVKTTDVSIAKPATEKPVADVIKSVPKARRVSAPKPVQVKVKPVKVLKPRILKPVLKVL